MKDLKKVLNLVDSEGFVENLEAQQTVFRQKGPIKDKDKRHGRLTKGSTKEK